MTNWFILKDSSGKKSTSFTMMWASFWILTLWLALNIYDVEHIREFSAETATLWFSPIALLYFGRKGQKGKLAGEENGSSTPILNDDGKSSKTSTSTDNNGKSETP